MKNNDPTIKYFDLYGLRKEKYDFLENHDVKNTDWQGLEPKESNYFFVPKDIKGEEDYNNLISIKEIFGKYNAGIATGKDDVLVALGKNELVQRISIQDEEIFRITMRQQGVKDSLIEQWLKELKDREVEGQIKEYNYRPFDKRWTIYNKRMLQRSRSEIMDNFLKPNLGLCMTKQLSTDNFYHAFATDCLADRCFVSLNTREVTYIFPLLTYGETDNQGKLFEGSRDDVLHQNFTKEFKDYIYKDGLSQISPENIFNYIYAVLYSNIYREKYKEFLKIDFPKIPFTKNIELFQKLSKLGKKLVDFHLLKSAELDNPISKFEGDGENTIDNIRYLPMKISSGSVVPGKPIKFPPTTDVGGLVRINDNQFFTNIYENIWNYYIGGYQVLNKWLKDRKGRILSSEEIKTYCRIATAIHHTILIQKEIDKLYTEVEKSLIK